MSLGRSAAARSSSVDFILRVVGSLWGSPAEESRVLFDTVQRPRWQCACEGVGRRAVGGGASQEAGGHAGRDGSCPAGTRVAAEEWGQVGRVKVYFNGRAVSPCQWGGCRR